MALEEGSRRIHGRERAIHGRKHQPSPRRGTVPTFRSLHALQQGEPRQNGDEVQNMRIVYRPIPL